MTSSLAALTTRATHVNNGDHNVLRAREGERITVQSPQFGLQSATRLHVVGIASNRVSA